MARGSLGQGRVACGCRWVSRSRCPQCARPFRRRPRLLSSPLGHPAGSWRGKREVRECSGLMARLGSDLFVPPRRLPSSGPRALRSEVSAPKRKRSARPPVLRGRAAAYAWRKTALRARPQIRRDDPLNLSILLSGGKETNKDSPSSGERRGKSPAPNPPVLHGRRDMWRKEVRFSRRGPGGLSPSDRGSAQGWCEAGNGPRRAEVAVLLGVGLLGNAA